MANNIQNTNNYEDEIDLLDLINIFKRRWRIPFTFAILSLILSIPYSLSLKKSWEGNFKIVMDKKDTGNSLSNLNAGQRSLFGTLLGSQMNLGSGLNTEVVILESPLVLKPVFKFAKKLKSDSGENVEHWRYEKWVETNLNVKRKEGTSVLMVSYKDSNKNHILPILDLISETYQDYSKSERDNNIKNGITYAKEQLAEFKERSKKSNRNVDFYELEYGITKGTQYPGNLSSLTSGMSQIPDILRTGGAIVNSSSLPDTDVLTKLGKINLDIIRRRQYFKDTDKSIQNLLKEKEFLQEYIEKTAGGKITLSREKDLTKEKAQEIILKYKELKREADRDYEILNNLENNLINLKMSKAKETVAWKLISTPTLLDSPVAPKKKVIVGFAFFVSIISGLIAAILIDKKDGNLYKLSEFKSFLPIDIIQKVTSKESNAIEKHIKLLLKGPLSNYKSIGLLNIGEFDFGILELYKNIFKKNFNKKEFINSEDLLKMENCETILLIAQIGNVNRAQLELTLDQIKLQNNKVSGMILISSDL